MFTIVTVVIHQNDLLKQVRGGVIHNAVHGAQDDRQCLVDKDKDHGDLGQVIWVGHLLAPEKKKKKKKELKPKQPVGGKIH